MADVQHSSLAHASVHEPKHISIGAPGDSGKVITNSSSTAGTSEYRRLSAVNDIDGVWVAVQVYEINSSTAQTHYIPAPFDGNVVKVVSIIDDALTTADNVYTFLINAVSPTPSTMTVTQSGSAAGDIDSVTFSAGNSILDGQYMTIAGNGGNGATTVDTRFLVMFERT